MVDGRLYQNSLTGLGAGHGDQVEADHHPREKGEILLPDAPTVESFHSPLDHGAEFSGFVAVAKATVIHPLPQGLHDGRRSGKVHVRHPEGQNVLVVHAPLDAIGAAPFDGIVEGEDFGGVVSVQGVTPRKQA